MGNAVVGTTPWPGGHGCVYGIGSIGNRPCAIAAHLRGHVGVPCSTCAKQHRGTVLSRQRLMPTHEAFRYTGVRTTTKTVQAFSITIVSCIHLNRSIAEDIEDTSTCIITMVAIRIPICTFINLRNHARTRTSPDSNGVARS